MTQDERRLRKVMVVRVSRGQYAALEGAAAREHLLVSAWARRVLVRAAAARARRRAEAVGAAESVDGAVVVPMGAGRGGRRA
jgi:hypothetical protein